jgi:ATP/maltotriose-dependent transcriptional regulator MalT/DNA-binding SARP family transcriptional activator
MADGASGACPPTGVVQPIERPVLQELLDSAGRRRICVVIGAAGWGKSTAVASWTRDRRTAWLSCDDAEADLSRFVHSLIAALQPHVPAPVPDRPSRDPSGAENVRWATGAISDWLQRSLGEDLVLVLDDLQGLAPDGEAARVVEGLCRHAPERLHLFLVSRRELPFSLARLRGQGLVAEINAADMTFEVPEVAALLRASVGEQPRGLARRVWERTGGWPAAVHAAIELLRGVDPDQRLRVLERLTRPGERFHGYLVEEVLSCEPEWARALLNRLAAFGEVRSTVGLGLGVENAGPLVELTRRGLVRRSSGDGAGWSLVRPLADYFEHGAALSSSERVTLHSRAAQECVGRGAHAQAVRHLMAAGRHSACVELLVDHGTAMVTGGQVDAVLEAAELPPEYLADARIQRVLGHARQVRGQWAEAMECFHRAGHGHDDLEPALAWRVALLAFTRGEFQEVLAVCGRTRPAQEGSVDKTLVMTMAATALRMMGDLEGARAEAARAKAVASHDGGPRARASVYTALAMLSAAEGDRRLADAHWQDALHASEEAADDLVQMGWIRCSRATHVLDMGAPQQALIDAHIALDLGDRCENPFLTAHASTTRGKALVRLGMLDEALAAFGTAIDLFQNLGSRFLGWPLCGLGDLYRTRGQLVRARGAYEEALGLAEPGHDVLGLAAALIGLARVRAVDDLAVAHSLAGRAVALGEGLREVPAYTTRGWVDLLAGDRQGAARDAERAASAARRRRDGPGLAEALALTVLSSADPTGKLALLDEAIEILRECGCHLEEAAARVVSHRIGATIPDGDAMLAEKTLRDAGVDIKSRRAAGPLAVVVQFAPSVSIQALGSFRVMRDGVPVPKTAWKSKKARDLLKILVARRRPVPREQLMELLWPEADRAKSGNRLSVLLSMVRDVLQPEQVPGEPLTTDGDAVGLDLGLVHVDVEEFLTNAEIALAAHRDGHPDAIARLAAAVAVYTGDFLEDDPYQDWVTPLAEELRATYVALLQALATRLRQAGDVDGVVRYTLRLLEQDPYDEEAHLELVSVLLAAGRLGEARRRYQIYVNRMSEIDVDPCPMPRVAADTPRLRIRYLFE